MGVSNSKGYMPFIFGQALQMASLASGFHHCIDLHYLCYDCLVVCKDKHFF